GRRPAVGATHPYVFSVMDVSAFNQKAAVASSFDTLIAGYDNRGATKENWWKAVGGLPSGIPVPGGNDAGRKTRAESFWDEPADVAKGVCTQCHGNGPFFSSRWINQDDTTPTSHVGRVPDRDDKKPYTNAAMLLTNLH